MTSRMPKRWLRPLIRIRWNNRSTAFVTTLYRRPRFAGCSRSRPRSGVDDTCLAGWMLIDPSRLTLSAPGECEGASISTATDHGRKNRSAHCYTASASRLGGNDRGAVDQRMIAHGFGRARIRTTINRWVLRPRTGDGCIPSSERNRPHGARAHRAYKFAQASQGRLASLVRVAADFVVSGVS